MKLTLVKKCFLVFVIGTLLTLVYFLCFTSFETNLVQKTIPSPTAYENMPNIPPKPPQQYTIEHFTMKKGRVRRTSEKETVQKEKLLHTFKWETGKDYTNRDLQPVIKTLEDKHVNYLSKAAQKFVFALCGMEDCMTPDVAYYDSLKPGDEFIFIGRDQMSNSIQKFQTTGDPNSFSKITKITAPTYQSIVIITTYYNRPERLSLYLDFVNSIFESDPHVSVQLVTFFVEEGEEEENKKSIQFILEQKVLPKHKDRVHIKHIKGKFSKGVGLNVGSKVSHQRCPKCILLFYDMDMRFRNNFLDRCRAFAVRNYSVYFPLVYSLLEPQHPHTSVTQSLLQNVTVDNVSGIWRIHGFGMVCIHAEDFVRMSGVPEYTTWGREDNNYYGIVSQQMISYRLIEPDFIHTYHKK